MYFSKSYLQFLMLIISFIVSLKLDTRSCVILRLWFDIIEFIFDESKFIVCLIRRFGELPFVGSAVPSSLSSFFYLTTNADLSFIGKYLYLETVFTDVLILLMVQTSFSCILYTNIFHVVSSLPILNKNCSASIT